MTAADDARRRMEREKAKALGPGQWLDPPKPAKPKPLSAQRVCDAISKGRGIAAVAGEINYPAPGEDLDLATEAQSTRTS
ncbi:MAG TPA: hypothetical protein VLL82_15085 [Mycobacterium sp.]|nr:hypothetical protein [Mycobacterium sp.]